MDTRNTHKQTDRQTDRHRQTDRQTDRQTVVKTTSPQGRRVRATIWGRATPYRSSPPCAVAKLRHLKAAVYGLPSEAVPLPTGAVHRFESKGERRGEPPARSLDFGFPVRLIGRQRQGGKRGGEREGEGREGREGGGGGSDGRGRDREEVFLLIYHWARRSLSLPVAAPSLCRGGIPCTRVPS
jgi:hypothetical protein